MNADLEYRVVDSCGAIDGANSTALSLFHTREDGVLYTVGLVASDICIESGDLDG